ncbi:MAG: class II aldolase/adducin family protein [Rhodospirillales bacterium]|nr:class II aldolase/adducin family protein [Rhodospirillales bacterium]
MDQKDILEKKRELIAIARRSFERGLQTGTGGNISIRLGQGDAVIIKPSGVGFAECSEENLQAVDLDGNVLDGDRSLKPSKDMPFHLGIYRVREDVNGIVHVHSPWATSWGSAGKEIPTPTVHSRAKLKRIPLIPTGPDGGNQTPESIVDAYRDESLRAAILQDHGSVAVGKTLLNAQQVAELIEETAHIAAISQLIR